MMSQPPVSFPTLQQQHPAAFAPSGYPFHQQHQPQQQQVLPQHVQLQQQHQQQQQQQQQLPQAQQFFTPGFPQSQVPAPQQHAITQQRQFPHGAGPVPVHAGAMNPMMMPAGFAQHNPMAQAAFSQGFPHGVPTSMGQSMPMTLSPHASSIPAQVQQQQQQQPVPTSVSQNALYLTPTRPAQNPQPSQMQTQTPTSTPPAAQPASPAQVARDRARVSVLLDINSALIQEVVNLQSSGKAGLVANQPPSQQASPTRETSTGSPTPGDSETKATTPTAATKPSIEYIECMRRLQGNLAFLASLADRSKKAGSQAPQCPTFMNPPPHLTSMNDLYAKLNELFPNAPKQNTPHTPQTQPMQRPQHHGQLQHPDGQTATAAESAG